MYHKIEINQTLFSKKSPINIYSGNLTSYLDGCTTLQQKIAKVFLEFKYKENIHITNQYISIRVGCSVKTVIRCTNKFHADGFLIKKQKNQYSPNDYLFNAKVKWGKDAFDYWLNSQTPEKQELYTKHGIIIDHKNKTIFSPRNVPQRNTRYLSSILTLKEPLTKMRARTREAFRFCDKDGKKETANKGDAMKNENFITKPIEKLTKLLSLDVKDQLKLVAFTDQSLEYAIDYIEPFINGKKTLKNPVRDRVAWLISIAQAFCTKNGITPDWRRYYQLSQDLCLQILETERVSLPLLLEKRTNTVYKKWEQPKDDPIEVTVEKLKRDIVEIEHKEKIDSAPVWMTSYFKTMMSKKEKELEECEKSIAMS